MTTKEVAEICGVTEKTVRENAKTFGKVFENGKPTEWTEEELMKVQLVLMKNTQNRGNASTIGNIVEEAASNALLGGLTFQEIVNSGNVEAMKELTTFAMNACAEVAHNKQLESENKLLLEQKEAAEKETERIYQCNRNFHNNLYTASQIAKKLGITPNMVGRIANENGLKQDPIYGKLGKIQLNNGQWVNQFYYNEDALTVIESVIG